MWENADHKKTPNKDTFYAVKGYVKIDPIFLTIATHYEAGKKWGFTKLH